MSVLWMKCWGLCSNKACSCSLSSGLSDSTLVTCSEEQKWGSNPFLTASCPQTLPLSPLPRSLALGTQGLVNLLLYSFFHPPRDRDG